MHRGSFACPQSSSVAQHPTVCIATGVDNCKNTHVPGHRPHRGTRVKTSLALLLKGSLRGSRRSANCLVGAKAVHVFHPFAEVESQVSGTCVPSVPEHIKTG
eukprot:4925977-Lingulodinium_polyedra.AAC.1